MLADAQLEPQGGEMMLADALVEVPTGVGAPTIGLKKSLSHGSTQRGYFGGIHTPDSHSQQAFQTFRGLFTAVAPSPLRRLAVGGF